MQPIRPFTHFAPGAPLLEVDPTIVLSNLVTLICSCNHKPSSMRAGDAKLLENWFEIALKNVRSNDNRATLNSWWEAGVKDAGRTAQDWKDPTRIFLEPFREFINMVIIDPKYIKDAGEELRTTLLQTPYWEEIYVTSPALGWPRRYLQFKCDLTAGMPLFGTALGGMLVNEVDEGSGRETTAQEDAKIAMIQAQRGLAVTLWAMDRVMLSDKLIPQPKTLLGERDEREGFLGNARAAQRQAIHMTAVPMLYYMQLSALWPRMTANIDALGERLARELYPRDLPAIDMRAKLKSHFASLVPTHPVTDFLANLFLAKPKLSTYFGEHEAILIPVGTDIPSIVGGYLAGSDKPTRSGIADLTLAASLAETLRLQALTRSGGASRDWVESILADVAPTLNHDTVRSHAAIDRGASFATAVEQLTLLSRYVTLWPQISKTMGWSSGPTINLGGIEAAAADFILSDGDFYSDTPIAALVGLRPVLPVSNPLTIGFSRRFMEDFNTGEDLREEDSVTIEDQITRSWITWSCIVCKGYMSVNAGDDALARYYLPRGMSMGEAGGELRFTDGVITDPIGKRVRDFFEIQSPAGFLSVGKPALPVKRFSFKTASTSYYATDWDAFVVGVGDKAGLQSILMDAYGSSKRDGSQQLLYREVEWKMRVPCQMSRKRYFIWVDETGNPVKSMYFDGHVLFDDKLDVNVDPGALDQLLDLLHTQPLDLLDGLSDPTSPPEG